MNRGCGHMEKSLGYSEMALPYTQPQMLNGSDGMEFPLNLDIDSWFIDFDFMSDNGHLHCPTQTYPRNHFSNDYQHSTCQRSCIESLTSVDNAEIVSGGSQSVAIDAQPTTLT